MRNKNAERKTDTEARIKAEFKRLLQKKPLKEISVSEICSNIGINRGTFYLHYIDILDLMQSVQKELTKQSLDILKENYHGGVPNKEMYRQYFDWICENKEGFQILFQDGMTRAETEFSELLIETWGRNNTSISKESLRCILAFVRAGTIAYINEAIQEESYTPEALDVYADFIESAIFKVIYHTA